MSKENNQLKAKLKELKVEDLRFGDFDGQFQNLHYSVKSSHAERSRQTPRKRSRRR